MATAAEDDDLDAKSLMRFITSAADNDSKSAEYGEDASDAIELDSGPHSSMLHASATAGARPMSVRSSNYRVPLTTPAMTLSSASHLSPLSTSPSRRLPEITLDLTSTAPVSDMLSAASPSSSNGGSSAGVTLPSPSPEAKKKSLLMASLAVGLNEVIPTDDDDDGNDISTSDDSAFAKASSNSSSRSPKKFSLGLPQKSSPSPKHSPTHSTSSSPTHASSKLLPISFSGSSASHAALKFDPILSCKDAGGDDAPARGDASSTYRRLLAASRSSLRTAGAAQDLDAFVAPSKLDPLDAETIRGSTYTPSPAAKVSTLPERKSMKLPSSMSLSPTPSSHESTAASQPSPSGSKPSASSPQDKLSPAQPKFRNPFKKAASKRLVADDAGDGEEEQSIDLVSDATHVSASRTHASTGATESTAPMDELAYLSFSPRPSASSGSSSAMSLGTKALALRELPSLSLASDAKDASGKRQKKPNDKHVGGVLGQTQAK